jgi:general secretion pathway protein C
MPVSSKLPPTFSQLSKLDGKHLLQLSKQKAPQLVIVAAAFAVTWQAAKLTWLFMTPASVAEGQMAPPQLPTINFTPIDSQQIANAYLFGNPSATPAQIDPNNLPISQLNLLLSGTMAMPKPEEGFAIVGESATNAKFYRVGASITGSVRLHSVYSDRIVIDNSGTLEIVKLPRGLPTTMPPPSASSAGLNIATPGDTLRKMVSANPNVLGDLFRAQPVLVNGAQKGYRIYPGRDREQFTRLGLQSGDLVTSVNGSALDDIRRGTEILNSLTASTTAQITVERNGVSQSLVLDMSQLNLPGNTGAQSSSEASASSSLGPRSGGLSGLSSANKASLK